MIPIKLASVMAAKPSVTAATSLEGALIYSYLNGVN